MASTYSIARFLNSELNVRGISDKSRNGLQVRASDDVYKVGAAVDASMEAFRKAAAKGCDMLIAHHGIYWKGKRDVLGLSEKRADYLVKKGVSLYAAHLPVDLHERYGNNILLAKGVGVQKPRKFGRYHGVRIGYMGEFENPIGVRELGSRLERLLGCTAKYIAYGPKRVRSAGIVSGGGAFAMEEAAALGLDCLITGEAPHQTYQDAKDLGMNVILAGHYHTETVGVKRLAEVVAEKYGVRSCFIDAPPKGL